MRLKKNLTGLILTVTFLTSVWINVSGQTITLAGLAFIKVSVDQSGTTIPLHVEVYHSFPGWDVNEVSDTLDVNATELLIRVPARTLSEGYISISNKRIGVLVIPGDTIMISVSGSDESRIVTFSGKSKNVQDYYRAKAEEFPINIGQQMMNAGMSEPLSAFTKKADVLYTAEKSFWKHYNIQYKLPQWFIRYESDRMIYLNAQLRLYVAGYKVHFQGKNVEIPAGYFTFLTSLPIRNEAAMYDYVYLHFLRDYFIYKVTNTYTVEYQRDADFKLAKETLGEKVGNFYKLFSISSFLIMDPMNVKLDLDTMTFPASYRNEVEYLKKRADTNINILRPGDAAPEFYLQNMLDSLVSLSQFRGQVVYLSFWFAGCKGCIQQFPRENELVQQFKGKAVKIVSICTRTTKTKWLETINRYNLQTENLYANTSRVKPLEKSYAVLVYPHYVLIGGDGKIIENFAGRSNEEISKKIEKALEALDSP